MSNKIKYGMPTLIECENIDECVDISKRLNLDFIEINMNLPQYQKDKIDIEHLENIIRDKDIFFTIHLDENLNVCDFNEEISKAYINTVLFSIDIAKRLNIPILNMHMAKGVYFTLPDKKVFLFERYKEIYLNKLIYFRDICAKAIGKSNIKICIENSSGYMRFMIEGIEKLLESDVFALTLDIGHAHATNNKDLDFIIKHEDRLKHMHIHDSINKKDHLPLGIGEIDIKDKLRLAKRNNCRCVLETKTIEGLKKSVEYINNFI